MNLRDFFSTRRQLLPVQRIGAGWNMAHAAVFLASDKARYVTGMMLPVDGGLLCKRG